MLLGVILFWIFSLIFGYQLTHINIFICALIIEVVELSSVVV